jgi:hypothetical protein
MGSWFLPEFFQTCHVWCVMCDVWIVMCDVWCVMWCSRIKSPPNKEHGDNDSSRSWIIVLSSVSRVSRVTPPTSIILVHSFIRSFLQLLTVMFHVLLIPVLELLRRPLTHSHSQYYTASYRGISPSSQSLAIKEEKKKNSISFVSKIILTSS